MGSIFQAHVTQVSKAMYILNDGGDHLLLLINIKHWFIMIVKNDKCIFNGSAFIRAQKLLYPLGVGLHVLHDAE